jgi:hypothetical protein
VNFKKNISQGQFGQETSFSEKEENKECISSFFKNDHLTKSLNFAKKKM